MPSLKTRHGIVFGARDVFALFVYGDGLGNGLEKAGLFLFVPGPLLLGHCCEEQLDFRLGSLEILSRMIVFRYTGPRESGGTSAFVCSPDTSTVSPGAIFLSSSSVHNQSGYSSSSSAMIFGWALVYPRPLSSAPPATELLGLAGFLDATPCVDDGPVPDFALDVEGVCGSDSGWDLPAVLEDCVGLLAPSMEIDDGA